MKNKTGTTRIFALFCIVIITSNTSCKKEDTSPTATTTPASTTVPHSAAKVPGNETLLTAGNGTFIIVNRKSGKPLDVSGQSTANGAKVLQWSGNGGTNQRWTLTQLTGGYYSIVGVQSSKALEIASALTTNNANTDIWTYSSGTHQQWQFTSLGNGYYRIINRNSGKDLTVAGQSVNDGDSIQQYDYLGVESQQWALLQATFSGQLGWTLTTTGVPSDVQTRITAAMNGAVARYNANANWPARTLTVEYNTGVATADGSTSGNIRFGASSSYQTIRTAMHEIGHTYGVGISSGWTANISGGYFVGTNAVDMLATFDGPGAIIYTGGGHFWPYGLNYETEWSETNGYRHVKIVAAMVSDGM
ncbi:Ricin-type beta-trefoil lectin domain-like [Filimonas lacunae]|uniref:Ricin-type beta-trefoil lectin domain-like n=1 Tax=Filimonas lacunae TaxID=477680 RepID=A0A173MJ88_9BACT|nr:RICIN domain-containing protein [Filimonas lacunae]BAV07471.1 xylosidase/arabinosidase [Filimonas lacunae]SIT30249.1 Ricin-type beta-trefoil lectin domain-like [Filimonas lacunae]